MLINKERFLSEIEVERVAAKKYYTVQTYLQGVFEGLRLAEVIANSKDVKHSDNLEAQKTVRSKLPVQQAKHKITPKKCKCAYVSDCNYKPGSIECSMNRIPA